VLLESPGNPANPWTNPGPPGYLGMAMQRRFAQQKLAICKEAAPLIQRRRRSECCWGRLQDSLRRSIESDRRVPG